VDAGNVTLNILCISQGHWHQFDIPVRLESVAILGSSQHIYSILTRLLHKTACQTGALFCRFAGFPKNGEAASDLGRAVRVFRVAQQQGVRCLTIM